MSGAIWIRTSRVALVAASAREDEARRRLPDKLALMNRTRSLKAGRGRGLIWGALALLWLGGCRDNLRSTANGAASQMPTQPAVDQAAEPSGEREALANSSELGPADIEGRWLSPSCGERGYARIISLEGGRFRAEDRVAPCPEGAQCIWSGIVHRVGTYSFDGAGAKLSLAVEPVEGPRAGASFPDELFFEEGLVELGSSEDGGQIRCAYSRMAEPER